MLCSPLLLINPNGSVLSDCLDVFGERLSPSSSDQVLYMFIYGTYDPLPNSLEPERRYGSQQCGNATASFAVFGPTTSTRGARRFGAYTNRRRKKREYLCLYE